MNTIIEQAPQEWKTRNFKEIAKERSSRVDNPGESGYEIYVGLEHLDSGSLIVKRHGSTKDVTSSMKLFKKGDILFARRNTYLRRCSVATFDGVCSGDIIVLQPILNHIVEGFLSIFMQFEPLENRIISLSAGAFSKRIKWRQLAEEKIPIPSKEEQQKIVETVWSIQENIQKTEKLIETTEKLKQGLLNELLTKGIGHTRFKDSELGRIPEEWEVVKLGDISNVRRGASPRPINDSKYFASDGAGWIRIADVTSTYKYINKTSQYLSELGISKSVPVHRGDLIMSICATIGKPVIIDMDACIHDGFVLFSDIKKGIISDLLFYVLLKNEKEFESKRQVGTQGNLNTAIVKETKISLPNTLEEQKKIVSIFEHVDNMIDTYRLNLSDLGKLKNKISNEVIAGKLKI